MLWLFKEKISGHQVDLYISDKILGIAKKLVAIVESEDLSIVDGEGVVFLAAGLFINATYLVEQGKKSEVVRIKAIGFVKHYLDSKNDKEMLERLSDNTRWFSQGNMSSSWYVNQVISDICELKDNAISAQLISNKVLEMLTEFFNERTATISKTLGKDIYPFYNPK